MAASELTEKVKAIVTRLFPWMNQPIATFMALFSVLVFAGIAVDAERRAGDALEQNLEQERRLGPPEIVKLAGPCRVIVADDGLKALTTGGTECAQQSNFIVWSYCVRHGLICPSMPDVLKREAAEKRAELSSSLEGGGVFQSGGSPGQRPGPSRGGPPHTPGIDTPGPGPIGPPNPPVGRVLRELQEEAQEVKEEATEVLCETVPQSCQVLPPGVVAR